MREIELSNGGVVLVDKEDYEELARYSWSRASSGYARRSVGQGKGRTGVYMHYFILPKKPGFQVDHRNRNKLDNRRENLRYATPAQNAANTGARSGSVSRFKGVRRSSNGKRWQAFIIVDGEFHQLGNCDTEAEAARRRNAAEIRYRGEFAVLNDIYEGEHHAEQIPLFVLEAA